MSEQFWGREKELSTIRKLYADSEAVFLKIYGRRRVGKTELVRQFLSEVTGKSLYYYVDLAEDAILMKTMTESISQQLNETIIMRSWDDFFYYIADKAKERFVLAIDEAPRFLDDRSIFLTRLQLAWDTHPGLKNSKIMIILIGSSIGMMEKITGKNGPLYGRVTHTIKLNQLGYKEFRTAFPELEEPDKIQHYSVFGGTPHYILACRKETGSIVEKIQKLMVSRQASLSNEAEQLFISESIREPARYVSILQAIANGKVELDEITNETGIQKEQIPVYLKRLDKLLNLISSADPIGGKKKNARYTISDPFFKFWFKFIFPSRSSIEIGNTKDVMEKINNELQSYCGGMFEQICTELLMLYQQKQIDGLPILFDKIGKWWNRKGDEIDIIAIHNKTRTVYVIDVLYSANEYSSSDFDALNRRIELFGFAGNYKRIIISKSGFSKHIKDFKIEETVMIDLKKLTKLFEEA